jgi:LysM repeat protein
MEPQATQMRSSAGATPRILAVVALVVGAIVVGVVVAGSIGGSGDGGAKRRDAGVRDQPTQKYYVVQPGDTFAGIANKEGVSVSRLEQLNPNLDTQLLPEKGCVDLVPDGCKELANGG